MFPNKLYIASNYLFKVNNRNTKTSCEICSKITKKTPERRQWLRVVLVFSLLNLNIVHTLFQCFYCWLWADNCVLGSNGSESSHFEVFFKMVFVESGQNLWKMPWRSSFFSKVKGWRPGTLLKMHSLLSIFHSFW